MHLCAGAVLLCGALWVSHAAHAPGGPLLRRDSAREDSAGSFVKQAQRSLERVLRPLEQAGRAARWLSGGRGRAAAGPGRAAAEPGRAAGRADNGSCCAPELVNRSEDSAAAPEDPQRDISGPAKSRHPPTGLLEEAASAALTRASLEHIKLHPPPAQARKYGANRRPLVDVFLLGGAEMLLDI